MLAPATEKKMSSLKGVDRLLGSRHCEGLVLFDITIVSYHSVPFSPSFSVLLYAAPGE
jgi:hypothetical protein